MMWVPHECRSPRIVPALLPITGEREDQLEAGGGGEDSWVGDKSNGRLYRLDDKSHNEPIVPTQKTYQINLLNHISN